jgi:hypothetical protein
MFVLPLYATPRERLTGCPKQQKGKENKKSQ